MIYVTVRAHGFLSGSDWNTSEAYANNEVLTTAKNERKVDSLYTLP